VRYFFQFEFFAFFGSFFFNLGRYFSFFMVIFSWVFYNSFFVFDNLGLSFFYHVFVDFLLRVFFVFVHFYRYLFRMDKCIDESSRSQW
jgi:hypothetical protein